MAIEKVYNYVSRKDCLEHILPYTYYKSNKILNRNELLIMFSEDKVNDMVVVEGKVPTFPMIVEKNGGYFIRECTDEEKIELGIVELIDGSYFDKETKTIMYVEPVGLENPIWDKDNNSWIEKEIRTSDKPKEYKSGWKSN